MKAKRPRWGRTFRAKNGSRFNLFFVFFWDFVSVKNQKRFPQRKTWWANPLHPIPHVLKGMMFCPWRPFAFSTGNIYIYIYMYIYIYEQRLLFVTWHNGRVFLTRFPTPRSVAAPYLVFQHRARFIWLNFL